MTKEPFTKVALRTAKDLAMEKIGTSMEMSTTEISKMVVSMASVSTNLLTEQHRVESIVLTSLSNHD